MQLELSEQERLELLELVREEHDELGAEIHHARVRDFRERLVRRRELLHDLIQRLQEPAAVHA